MYIMGWCRREEELGSVRRGREQRLYARSRSFGRRKLVLIYIYIFLFPPCPLYYQPWCFTVMLMCGAVGAGITSPRPGEQSNGWREESGWSSHEGGASRLCIE